MNIINSELCTGVPGSRLRMKKRLLEEVNRHGCADNVETAFHSWYMEMEEVRRYLQQILYTYQPSFNNPYVLNGHRIDHHIYGYLAPLDFMRQGLSKKVLTPAEHLIAFSEQFKSRGIRFIYAALPCKKAVYPEIILPDEFLGPGGVELIPQWRKMVYELLDANMEVIDFYPIFRKRRDEVPLFSYGHDVSAAGALLVGKTIAEYLMNTIDRLDPICDEEDIVCEPIEWTEDGRLFLTKKVCFRGEAKRKNAKDLRSKIGIFGNCNLQKYVGRGVDITSQISAAMGYPVNNLGRILPFSGLKEEVPSNAPEGIFAGKEIVIYLGFPSAAYVRASHVNCSWAWGELTEKHFR